MFESIKKYFIPAILSVLLAVLFYLSIPVSFNKFLVKPLGIQTRSLIDQVVFADVTGDGNDEIIGCGGFDSETKANKRNGCTIYGLNENLHGHAIEQVNVPERFNTTFQCVTADLNHNGKYEIYVGGVNGNDIVVYGFEYPNLSEPFIKAKVDTFVRYLGNPDLSIENANQYDVDKDGIDELYFTICNSYPIYPRKLYRLNIVKNEIIASPSACFRSRINSMSTINGQELIIGSGGSGSANYKDSMNIPFSDYGAYAVALDQDLNYLFPPKKVTVFPGSAETLAYEKNLYTVVNKRADTFYSVVLKLNTEGEILDSILFNCFKSKLFLHNRELALIADDSLIFLDKGLNVLRKFQHKEINRRGASLDLNMDGKQEYVCENSALNSTTIFSPDFEHITEINNIPEPLIAVPDVRKTKSATQLVLHGVNKSYFYSYEENSWYPFRWFYYAAILAFSVFISFFSFSMFRKSIEKRHKQELKMNRLQMLSIKNQVDPHFTLNALNSIDYMYQNNEKEKAGKFMVKLSRLMHQTLMNSDKMVCSLYEELDFIRTYCQLQQIKLTVPFECNIHVDENLDPMDFEIPKQLIFTYVENAVKHGIRPKPDGGFVHIDVSKKEHTIKVIITDNGIGMTESKNQKTSDTGKGLKIIDEIIQLYKDQKGIAITTSVSSSKDGTMVNINIPIT